MSEAFGAQPVDVSDKFVVELATWLVVEHSKKAGIEASLVAVESGSVEVGPNGKTYSLKLKLKEKDDASDSYVYKIFQATVFVPYIGLWSVVAFNYIEDASI